MIDKLKFKKEGLWFGDFLLYLSQDEMLVYLPVKPSEWVLLKDFIKNWETIKEELKKANIFGVLEEPELVDNKLIVAKGTPPKPPIPEKLEFLEKFAPLLSEPKTEKLELDTQDLREAPKRLICVEPNEIIAKWIPPIPGIPGMNVLGEPIPSPEVRESAKIILGKNFFIDEEGWVKAKTSGVVGLQGNKLEILPEYTIEGDVDFSVGNIMFVGKKLTIKGDIKFGFKVRVKGDLELYGGTENKVLIEVEGNFLCDGILRGEETKVKVKGRAEVKGIEHASLEVDGDLLIKNYMIFVKAIVSGDCLATIGKGLIYGTEIKCGGNVEVKILGNESQTLTKVYAGYKTDLITEYFEVLQKSIIYEETLNKLQTGIEMGKKLIKEGRVTPEKEKIIKRLFEQYELYDRELKKLLERLKELKKNLGLFKQKTVKVLEKVYPGVIIGISDQQKIVTEEIKGPLVFFYEESGVNCKKI
ncbi:DUF342 domain-containing protein [Thermodesulfobacterium thermophilum]|uniref:DUF342 domain-containing protein n=1 Tax=Thermodesulfobacterium thermophilum TaxID=886 RepID=UPI0003B59563|nr:FapA family protein [Thermodesulfobacterium thermophilum]